VAEGIEKQTLTGTPVPVILPVQSTEEVSMWPDEENENEYEENERCGDVERDEVKGLVEDEDREELSGFLSW
tara:strand:- start:118 stop:333 length:216 start_codon:yes stop_codon:yes gene_type:complete